MRRLISIAAIPVDSTVNVCPTAGNLAAAFVLPLLGLRCVCDCDYSNQFPVLLENYAVFCFSNLKMFRVGCVLNIRQPTIQTCLRIDFGCLNKAN